MHYESKVKVSANESNGMWNVGENDHLMFISSTSTPPHGLPAMSWLAPGNGLTKGSLQAPLPPAATGSLLTQSWASRSHSVVPP
jgi:hypothetical protein